MRKRLKKKRYSCRLCKPHKTGGAIRWERWEAEEFAKLKEFEQEKLILTKMGGEV